MERVHHSHMSGSSRVNLFGFAAAVARRVRERRQMNALLKMDGHMLQDIGLSLGDIQRVAGKSIWRD